MTVSGTYYVVHLRISQAHWGTNTISHGHETDAQNRFYRFATPNHCQSPPVDKPFAGGDPQAPLCHPTGQNGTRLSFSEPILFIDPPSSLSRSRSYLHLPSDENDGTTDLADAHMREAGVYVIPTSLSPVISRGIGGTLLVLLISCTSFSMYVYLHAEAISFGSINGAIYYSIPLGSSGLSSQAKMRSFKTRLKVASHFSILIPGTPRDPVAMNIIAHRSEEHTSELQSLV